LSKKVLSCWLASVSASRMQRFYNVRVRKSINLHEADFNRRTSIGIVSRMQQSLVHKNIVWPLHIHIQRIPATHLIK